MVFVSAHKLINSGKESIKTLDRFKTFHIEIK